MGLDLTTEEIAALERRTEAWITAIQLAALSLRGREDIAGFRRRKRVGAAHAGPTEKTRMPSVGLWWLAPSPVPRL